MHNNFTRLSATLGLKFGPVRKGITPKKILEYVLNDLVMIQADSALASDPDVVTKYQGMMEAYKDVAHFIAPFKTLEIKVDEIKSVAEAAATTK